MRVSLTCTPGTSTTTGSDGGPGSDAPASFTAATLKRYMMPYRMLERVHRGS